MPPTLVWRCSHRAVGGAVPHLQVGDVAVNVHGGCLAVLRDVLVVLRARLPIHTIDAGDGYILIASGYIPADDLLGADSPVPYPEPKLSIELQCKPHLGALWGQVPCCVPFFVPKLRVGSTRQKQPEEEQKA